MSCSLFFAWPQKQLCMFQRLEPATGGDAATGDAAESDAPLSAAATAVAAGGCSRCCCAGRCQEDGGSKCSSGAAPVAVELGSMRRYAEVAECEFHSFSLSSLFFFVWTLRFGRSIFYNGHVVSEHRKVKRSPILADPIRLSLLLFHEPFRMGTSSDMSVIMHVECRLLDGRLSLPTAQPFLFWVLKLPPGVSYLGSFP